MENIDLNETRDDEIQIPVNLEKYLKDNLSVFKFLGEVANMYSAGFIKVGLNMIEPSSYDFDKENDEESFNEAIKQ